MHRDPVRLHLHGGPFLLRMPYASDRLEQAGTRRPTCEPATSQRGPSRQCESRANDRRTSPRAVDHLYSHVDHLYSTRVQFYHPLSVPPAVGRPLTLSARSDGIPIPSRALSGTGSGLSCCQLSTRSVGQRPRGIRPRRGHSTRSHATRSPGSSGDCHRPGVESRESEVEPTRSLDGLSDPSRRFLPTARESHRVPALEHDLTMDGPGLKLSSASGQGCRF